MRAVTLLNPYAAFRSGQGSGHKPGGGPSGRCIGSAAVGSVCPTSRRAPESAEERAVCMFVIGQRQAPC